MSAMWLRGALVCAGCLLFFPFLASTFLFLESFIWLTAIVAVYQERKIWLHPSVPSLTAFGMVKVFLLNVVWMTVCFVGTILVLIEAAATGHWLDLKHTRELAHKVVERKCAVLVCSLFVGPVVVKGTEHLPSNSPGSPAPVFVANHCSQIDTAAVYFLERHWRWIMKSSIMYLPGVGQITYLGDHIWIDRNTKRRKESGGSGDSITGARNLYAKSDASIREGVPMFFFPQGTRRMGERLPFKDGAFKVATNNDSVLVPVSIEIPLTAWNSMYPFAKADPVVLTVHESITSKGKDVETLKKETAEVIYSVLPDHSNTKND